jgi:hypothetical protein
MSFVNKMQFMLESLFGKIMKMIPSSSGKILTNKWILYFIFVVGIYDAIHFYRRGNMPAFAIFFIVGFLTSFFSKNMIIIIISAIAVSHIFAYGNKMAEGMENEEDEEIEEGMEDGEEEANKEEANKETEAVVEEEETPKKKTKKSTDEDATETDAFSNLSQINKLLQDTEKILQTSKQDGFTTIGKYSEYR